MSLREKRFVFSDYCIAARMGNTIILHKDLFKFDKDWAKKVLDHELKHSGRFTLKDFGMDFFEGDVIKNIHFLIKHPKALIGLLPIRWFRGEFVWDPNLFIIYGLLGLLVFFFFKNLW